MDKKEIMSTNEQNTNSLPNSQANSKQASEADERTIDSLPERQRVMIKVIELILKELEIPGNGNLTSLYAIHFLEDTIQQIKYSSGMRPLKESLLKKYW